MRELTLGQYYASDSPVHRLDPRTKLVGILLYVFILFMIKNPIWFLPVFVTVLALYRFARIPFRYFLKGLRGILFILIFTFALRLFFTPGTEIAKVWVLVITEEGLAKAIRLTSRIGLMIVGAALLSYTTTPRELADGMEKGFSFLEKVHIPVQFMAVVTMIAFRFIPVLMEEINILMEAQKARGAEFEHCSVWKKCKNVYHLLFPLFLSVIRRSMDLALAMEARGYRENHPTTRMYPLVYKKADKIAYGCMYIYVILICVLMYMTY